MTFVRRTECVDCGACEPVCPVEAIYDEDDESLEEPESLDDDPDSLDEELESLEDDPKSVDGQPESPVETESLVAKVNPPPRNGAELLDESVSDRPDLIRF